MIFQTGSARIRSFINALIVPLVLVACGTNTDSQIALEKAKQYLKQQNSSAAIIELKNVLQLHPESAEGRFLLGKTYLEDDQGAAAEIELRKALDLNFSKDKTLPLIANSLLIQGKSEKLLSEFGQQKMQSVEAQAELTSLIGLAYLNTGKLDEAQIKFIEAQKIRPDHPVAVLGNARVLAEKSDYSGAEAMVNTILSKEPMNASALIFKGDLYRSQNEYEKAVSAYEIVVSEDPKNIKAHLNLIDAYLANGQMDTARTKIASLKKLFPQYPVVSYFEALIAFNNREYEKADEAIQRTLFATPEYPPALILAGSIELELNRPILSEQHLRKALSLVPDNLFALKKLVALYTEQKDSPKALETLQSAIRVAPNDPELLSMAGELAMAKGELHLASGYLDQAIRLTPKNPHVLTQSAIAQLAQGNSEQGIAQLESASKLDVKSSRPDLLLILAHVQGKEYDKALQSWKSIQKKEPSNPLVYNLQAAILLAKKDFSGAREALMHTLMLQPTNLDAASNLAKLDMSDKNPEAAKQRFRSILEKDKTNLPALLALASLEQSTGATKQVVLKWLNLAKAGNPQSTEPILAIVKYYMDTGDFNQALATTNEALLAAPKNQQLLETAGMLQTRTGALNEATATYAKLVAENPKETRYLLSLGEAQLFAGKIEEAKASFFNALQLKPEETELQVAVVNALINTGKTEDALKMVDQLRAIAPKSSNLEQLKGDIWMAKHFYVAASTAYMEGLKTAPTSGLLIKTHRALMLANKKTQAEKVLERWLLSYPYDTTVQIYSADFSASSGNFMNAKTEYEKLIKNQPDNPLLLNNLAWVSFQLNDPKALEYAEKAYALAPSNPDIVDTFGWILVEQGQLKRGTQLLEDASIQFPKQTILKLHLAKALIKDKRIEAARDLLRAVKESGDSALAKESAQLLIGLSVYQ